MRRFDLAEQQFCIRADSRERRRFCYAVTADAGKDDSGRILEPRCFLFQPPRIEEDRRHGKMAGNGQDRRLVPAAVDGSNGRELRPSDAGCPQRLDSKRQHFRSRRPALAAESKNMPPCHLEGNIAH